MQEIIASFFLFSGTLLFILLVISICGRCGFLGPLKSLGNFILNLAFLGAFLAVSSWVGLWGFFKGLQVTIMIIEETNLALGTRIDTRSSVVMFLLAMVTLGTPWFILLRIWWRSLTRKQEIPLPPPPVAPPAVTPPPPYYTPEDRERLERIYQNFTEAGTHLNHHLPPEWTRRA